MNAKRRWYELLLPGLAVLLVVAAGSFQTAKAYEYVQNDPVAYADDSDDYYRGDSTYTESATSTGVADANTGSCSCSVDVYTKATGNSAWADADGYGTYVIDWGWTGPPGVAPGGTLTWSQSATGSAYAYGYNYLTSPSTQWASSASDAESESWSTGTEGSAYADIYVWGSITDGDTIDGDTSASASPSEGLQTSTPQEYRTPPDYAMYISSWTFSADDDETIAWGTTYVYFAGGADCSALASSGSGGTGVPEANAHGEATATADVSASFP